ncbi:hypothetical protein ACQ4M3_07320 [Leptolyngbya sp. AN03gr2]|uniref:hypothetical protein n=1 Tax=unclassified Leptolyngbya TaxID=2650499 RepID=UPI003D323470
MLPSREIAQIVFDAAAISVGGAAFVPEALGHYRERLRQFFHWCQFKQQPLAVNFNQTAFLQALTDTCPTFSAGRWSQKYLPQTLKQAIGYFLVQPQDWRKFWKMIEQSNSEKLECNLHAVRYLLENNLIPRSSVQKHGDYKCWVYPAQVRAFLTAQPLEASLPPTNAHYSD